jgi:predicted dinucleotide-binding enzyme
MEDKLTIAIFDATGPVGMALAKTLSKGPYRLLLLSDETPMLRGLQSEILNYSWDADVEAIKSLPDTRSKADVFILAGPHATAANIARAIEKSARGKIVISISNPDALQKLLPDSKVVEAFSTISLADFRQPVFNGKQVDSFIAGNDESAIKIVDQLVRTAGFNPVIQTPSN